MNQCKVLKIIFLIFLIFFTFEIVSYTYGNPFSQKQNTVKRSDKKGCYPVFVRRVVDKIIPFQRKMNQKLAELTQQVKEKKSLKVIILIIFFSFMYGVVHGLGPGHGKTIVFSYFLSRKSSAAKGIFMGSLMGLMHAASAVVMVMILYFIIKKAFFISFENVSYYIKLVSYGLIFIIGFVLFVKAILDLTKKEKDNPVNSESACMKDMIPLIVAVGIVPCPGAVIILLFCISQEVITIGLISTLFMACGMSTAISLVGVATISAKKGFLRISTENNKIFFIIKTIFELIGYLIIILFGLLFLLVTL